MPHSALQASLGQKQVSVLALCSIAARTLQHAHCGRGRPLWGPMYFCPGQLIMLIRRLSLSSARAQQICFMSETCLHASCSMLPVSGVCLVAVLAALTYACHAAVLALGLHMLFAWDWRPGWQQKSHISWRPTSSAPRTDDHDYAYVWLQS